MQIRIPFEVEYETAGTVPIDDIIASLESVRGLLQEAGGILDDLPLGVDVEHLAISVRRISHESPLRELFIVSLIIAFQEDLDKTVPPLLEKVPGVEVPDGSEKLFTVLALIAVFYGVGFAKDVITSTVSDGPIRREYNALIDELAKMTGISGEDIKKKIEKRYKKSGSLSKLSRNALGFFRPSKRQDNAPIRVHNRRIESTVIKEVPDNFQFDHENSETSSVDLYGVEVEIHAQDRDKGTSGWAAVIPGKVDKRLPMKLVEGVQPDQLWQQDTIRGDVTVVMRRDGLENRALQIHLKSVQT